MIGSSTDAMRRGRLKEFGADLAVDSSDPGWVKQVLDVTGGEGVDLIVDQVSGKVAGQNLAATKILAASSMSAGSAAPTPISTSTCTPPPHPLYRRHLPHPLDRGSPRDLDEVRRDIWAAVESRKLQLPIDKVYKFADIGKAFEHMEANKHLGKIVVTL